MEHARLYASSDGESHLEDVQLETTTVEFAPPAPPLDVSTPVPAQRCLFARVPKGWYGEWHPTPHRQYYIQLSGELEIEVGDGERRRLGPGHVILLEDVDGRGHRSRVLGDTAVTGCFIQLPDGG